jgi:hypothetical protein
MTSVPETAYGHIEIKEERATANAVARTDATETAVREYFKDIPVLVSIARCESHFRHTLADGSVLHGERDPADIGVMQINARYHAARAKKLGLDLNLLADNMAYARGLYEKQGTAPWNASAPCWNRTLAQR